MTAKLRPRRAINGILLLDKATGITSNGALQQVKQLYQASKAGHTGSLDPLATGMLPICLGEATKISGYLLDADKSYHTECRLGISTDSGDSAGQIIQQRPVPNLTATQIETALDNFRGAIQQIPPMYSALKHQGQPLYKLARQGIAIERKARTVQIYQLKLLQQQADSLQLAIDCSKGTYIRSLVMDLGELLGCGAHITMLRRTAIKPFLNHPMYTWETLVEHPEPDTLLLPLDIALSDWPAVYLDSDAYTALYQGKRIAYTDKHPAKLRRLYRQADATFFGIGELITADQLAAKRLLQLNLP